MKLLYNIDFELAVIGYLITMYIFLRILYSGQSEINRRFLRLTFFVLLSDIMDVVTAVTISYGGSLPAWFNAVMNTLYFGIVSGMAYYFLDYVAAYTYSGEERGALPVIHRYVLFIYYGILGVNLFQNLLFYFDAQGEYIHGPLYFLVYIVPSYYILATLWILFRNHKCFAMKQKISTIAFVILTMLGPVLQLVVFPNVLLSLYTVAIADLIVFFSMETPDYQRLVKTLDELGQAKNEAEHAKYAAELAKSEAEEAGIRAYEASQAKSEFLKNMSHEVRTPINAILGYNELLIKETNESQTASYASNVQKAGRTLLYIMNDILDFINIDNGSLKLDENSYFTLSMLQDMVTYGEHHADKKKLEFRVSIDKNIPCELHGDMSRLIQISNNLLSNAIKFTKKGFVGFKITWKPVDAGSGFLMAEVSDSGIGMTQDSIKIIANSFSRVDHSNTRNIQGIGLGLSIVTKLLDLMGSKLEVQSKYEEGSTFSFAVKQKIVDSSPLGEMEWGQSRMAPSENMYSKEYAGLLAPEARVLAVDDNEMNLELFQGLLKDTQIQIETAVNGEKALGCMESGNYHIIFLDHMMPLMDGVETLREMRRRKLCEGVPVIALTANAIIGAKEEYLKEGFDDYLSKPVIQKQLVEILRRYLPADVVLDEDKDKQDGVAGSMEGSFLERLPLLDTSMGMAYCGGSEDLYREVLMSFLENGKPEEMRRFFKEENWENYRIHMHALKSTSLSIGALGLSDQAGLLEKAVKDGDTAYIKEHHGEVLRQYQLLLEQMGQALSEPESSTVSDAVMQDKEAHILVVDDDSMNLRVAETMLEVRYFVSCVKSGEETLAFLEREIPDLILLDIHMPGMDGFEVIDRVKEDRRYVGIPVIFLTADNDREAEIQSFKHGALDFITKPFVVDIMMQRVKRILELDRLQKNLQHEVAKQTKKAEERRQKIERMSDQIMEALAGTIDAKDTYTNGHSVRVAEYSREMMRRMGGTEQEQEDVYRIGLLHDIGKIGIPDVIISKASGLTEEEYGLIKSHPVIGADILKNISEIPEIDVGARWHHEKYDGTGYPDGLKGKEIPMMARLIGVADAYDAMASKRSYRDVLPQETVRREIEEGRGTQFDPEFADIMLRMIDDDVNYDMREK